MTAVTLPELTSLTTSVTFGKLPVTLYSTGSNSGRNCRISGSNSEVYNLKMMSTRSRYDSSSLRYKAAAGTFDKHKSYKKGMILIDSNEMSL